MFPSANGFFGVPLNWDSTWVRGNLNIGDEVSAFARGSKWMEACSTVVEVRRGVTDETTVR